MRWAVERGGAPRDAFISYLDLPLTPNHADFTDTLPAGMVVPGTDFLRRY